MQRRQFTTTFTTLFLARASCLALLAEATNAFALSESDAATGVRAALSRGADSAVSLLGKPGGFLDNPQVRIPLPGALDSAASMLRAIGQGHRVDDLVNSMNRAAEQAVPEARPLLLMVATLVALLAQVNVTPLTVFPLLSLAVAVNC